MDDSRDGSRQAERVRPTNINVIYSLTVLPHEKALLRRARRLVSHEADARDLVQETLERALRTFHAFRPGTAVWAWLRTIMNSVCFIAVISRAGATPNQRQRSVRRPARYR